jgi:hypothetical protein
MCVTLMLYSFCLSFFVIKRDEHLKKKEHKIVKHYEMFISVLNVENFSKTCMN